MNHNVIFPSFLCFLFCLFSLCSIAQTYSNEWIDYDKTYLRVDVSEEGIYRIPYQLIAEIFDETESISGSELKLITMGQEVPIYVSSSTTLSDGDFVEFYGEKNDGSFDTQLYKDPSHQINNDYSLFTDVRAYYLCVEPESENEHFTTVENIPNDQPVSEYFWRTEKQSYPHQFSNGEPDAIEPRSNSNGIYRHYFPGFGNKEGFTSDWVSPGQIKNFPLITNNIYESGLLASIETKLIGGSDDVYFDQGDHHVHLLFNETEFEGNDAVYEAYNSKIITGEIPTQLLVDTNQLQISTLGDNINNQAYLDSLDSGNNIYFNYPYGPDRNSLAHMKITYPHTFNFENDKTSFTLEDQNEKFISITTGTVSDNFIIYDLSNNLRSIIPANGQNFDLYLQQGSSLSPERKFYFTNETEIHTIEEIEQVNFIDFTLAENVGNYFLIYHPILSEGPVNEIESYAQYRSSDPGGGYQVQTIDIYQLYNQFSYGIDTHPLSIRHFANFILDTHPSMQFQVMLMGKGIFYNRTRNVEENFQNNLIPTYGNRAGDYEMLSRDIYDPIQQVPVGRLNAKSPEEVRIYLNKIITHEEALQYGCGNAPADWLDQSLQLLMAIESEFDEISNDVASYNTVPSAAKFNYETTLFEFEGDYFLNSQEMEPIISKINGGVSILNNLGGSNGEFWNIDIPFEELENAGKYPFVINNTKYSGIIFQPEDSEHTSSRVIFAEGKGGIAHIGAAWRSTYACMSLYNKKLYENIQVDNYGETLGEIIKATNMDMLTLDDSCFAGMPTEYVITPYFYHGDPAIRLPNKGMHDFITDPNSFYEGDQIDIGDEYFSVFFDVENLNKPYEGMIEFTLTLFNSDSGEEGELIYMDSVLVDEISELQEFQIPIANLGAGENNIRLTINSNNKASEYCFYNNNLFFTKNLDFNIGLGEIIFGEIPIKLYPNPVQSLLNIEAEETIEHVEIYSTTAKLLQKHEGIQQSSLQLNLNDLAVGIYFIEVKCESGVVKRKFLKD